MRLVRNTTLSKNTSTIIKDYLWIVFASFLTAVAVNGVFIHDGLAPGGLTGLALVVSQVINLEVELINLLISVPILLIATLVLGKAFGIKTLFMVLMTPLIMNVLPKVWLTEGLVVIHPLVELLAGAIIGGLCIGFSIGIALNHGCATGGTDILALLIQKLVPNVKLSNIILILDGIIIILSGFIKQNLFVAIFSFISLYIISKTIDFNLKKAT